MGSGAAVAAASRYSTGGSQIGGPLGKGLLSRLAGRSLWLLARAGTRDATNSFKAYSTAFVREVGIDSRHGFAIGIELTAKARRLRRDVAEIPTIWLDREDGESGFRILAWMPAYLRWYLFCFGRQLTAAELRPAAPRRARPEPEPAPPVLPPDAARAQADPHERVGGLACHRGARRRLGRGGRSRETACSHGERRDRSGPRHRRGRVHRRLRRRRAASAAATRSSGSTTCPSTASCGRPATAGPDTGSSAATPGTPGWSAELLAGCEHFIAAAAMVGGIGYFHAYPYDLLAANERITAAACDAAITAHRDGALRKVTFLSSSMVYENADRFPSREGQQLQVPPPVTAYGFQKLAVSTSPGPPGSSTGCRSRSCGRFNCVGVGETRPVRDGRAGPGEVRLATSHVVPDLVRRVLTGQDPLHVLGSGEQVRHYHLRRRPGQGHRDGDGASRGSRARTSTCRPDRGTTVTELATLIWHKINGPDSPPRLVYDAAVPRRRAAPRTRYRESRRLLGFTATTTLDQMLDEVIAWVREAIGAGLM